MPIRQHTEADAVDFAQRHGVRLATARTALGVLPQFSTDVPLWPEQSEAVRAYAAQHGLTVNQALKALSADVNRASATAADSMVATFNRANGIKQGKAPHRTRSAEVAADAAAPRMQPPAKTLSTLVSSDPKAGAARASACQAAAESIVALFKKSEGGKHDD